MFRSRIKWVGAAQLSSNWELGKFFTEDFWWDWDFWGKVTGTMRPRSSLVAGHAEIPLKLSVDWYP